MEVQMRVGGVKEIQVTEHKAAAGGATLGYHYGDLEEEERRGEDDTAAMLHLSSVAQWPSFTHHITPAAQQLAVITISITSTSTRTRHQAQAVTVSQNANREKNEFASNCAAAARQ